MSNNLSISRTAALKGTRELQIFFRNAGFHVSFTSSVNICVSNMRYFIKLMEEEGRRKGERELCDKRELL